MLQGSRGHLRMGLCPNTTSAVTLVSFSEFNYAGEGGREGRKEKEGKREGRREGWEGKGGRKPLALEEH